MMTTRRANFPFIILFIMISCYVLTGNAPADDISAILKKADKELRQAQRDMFSGKTEKAIAALENIENR